MPLKPSDIWPNENSYPSLEEIDRYAENKMNREETLSFEKKMADSPLLSDAVEGLLLEKAKNEIAINEITLQIDNKPKAKVIPFFNFTNLSIAASVLIFLTAGILFYVFRNQNTKTEIASAEKPKTSDSSTVYADKIVSKAPPSENSIALAEPITDNPKNENHESEVVNDNIEAKSTKDQTEQEDLISSAPSGNALRASGQVSSASENSLAESQAIMIDSAKSQSIADEMMAFANKTVLEEDLVMVGYGGEKKSDQAPAQSKELSERRTSKAKKPAPVANNEDQKRETKPSDQNTKPSLTAAEALISQNKYEKAIEELNAVIQQNDFEKESAFWLKAACLIKLDKVNEAKLILRELINSKGFYATQSSRMLEKLE